MCLVVVISLYNRGLFCFNKCSHYMFQHFYKRIISTDDFSWVIVFNDINICGVMDL